MTTTKTPANVNRYSLHGRYYRSVGQHWVPTHMELLRDGLFDEEWFDHLEAEGCAAIFGGVVVDSWHPDFDPEWIRA